MARNDQGQEPGSRARGGPTSTDPDREQADRDRNDLHRQADAQATPETEDQHRAVAERTGNAGRSIAAAEGREPSMDLRDDADRAYEDSRGARGERDNRPG